MKENQVYEDRVCRFCENNKTCNKKKYKTYVYGDRTTYRCIDYKYVPQPVKNS